MPRSVSDSHCRNKLKKSSERCACGTDICAGTNSYLASDGTVTGYAAVLH
jgi:hypothetical protein